MKHRNPDFGALPMKSGLIIGIRIPMIEHRNPNFGVSFFIQISMLKHRTPDFGVCYFDIPISVINPAFNAKTPKFGFRCFMIEVWISMIENT